MTNQVIAEKQGQATIKLAGPLHWVGPLIVIDRRTYRVLAISADRRTLTVESA